MNTLVIGDIHGCYAELQGLLDAAGLAEGDAIVAVGDVVDRGPDSVRAFEFIHNTPNARSVLGNHERKHVRAAQGLLELSLSQRLAREQFGAGYAEAVAAMAGWPRYLDLPEALILHGFWLPGKALHEQPEPITVGTLGGEFYLRRLDPRPWYERYDGPKPLIVGHHHYLGNGQPLIVNDRVFAIDTGCCMGGRLTGLLLPAFRIVSVASRGDYWGTVKKLYAGKGA